jgi:hypothetical protein
MPRTIEAGYLLTRFGRPLVRSNAGATDGWLQRAAIVGWHDAAGRAGTSVAARKNIDLVLTRTRLVTQPREFVLPLATLRIRRVVGPPWKLTVRLRTPLPASLTHPVSTANVRFPRLWRLVVIDTAIGSRTNDELCAVNAAFGVAVPGV